MKNRLTLRNPDLTTRIEQNNNHISKKPRLSKLQKFRKIVIVFILPAIMGFTFGECEGIFSIRCDKAPQIAYNDIFNKVCVTSDGRIYFIKDCDSLSLLYEVEGSPALYSITKRKGFLPYITVGEAGTIVKGAGTWFLVDSPTTHSLNSVCTPGADLPGPYYAVGDSGTIIKSNDQGTTWFSLPSPTTTNLYRVECNRTSSNHVKVFGAGFLAYRSSDGGNTWEDISPPLQELPDIDANMYGPLDIITSFFLNDSTGYIFGPFGLTFFTQDGGSSWLDRHAFEFEQINTAYFISVDSGMIAGDNGKIRFTTDGGLSWLEDTTASNITTQNINNVFVREDSVAVVVGDSGLVVFVATDSSLIIPVELASFIASVSENTITLNWTTATELNNSGFEIQRTPRYQEGWANIGFVEGHGTTTETQEYSYLDNTVGTGTYFYRLKQIDFSGQYEYSDVIEVEVNGPLTFGLEQNYPNPFNPSTLIKYSVPENGFVKLSVYNLVGEEVRVLVNETVDAGFYEATFNATSLPSGIYFYKLQTPNFTQTKKMILLK